MLNKNKDNLLNSNKNLRLNKNSNLFSNNSNNLLSPDTTTSIKSFKQSPTRNPPTPSIQPCNPEPEQTKMTSSKTTKQKLSSQKMPAKDAPPKPKPVKTVLVVKRNKKEEIKKNYFLNQKKETSNPVVETVIQEMLLDALLVLIKDYLLSNPVKKFSQTYKMIKILIMELKTSLKQEIMEPSNLIYDFF